MAADRTSPAYPECVTRLIEEFGRLPGIGRRSAERLAFFVLKSDEAEAMRLSQAIADVKRRSPPRLQGFDGGRERGQIKIRRHHKLVLNLEETHHIHHLKRPRMRTRA